VDVEHYVKKAAPIVATVDVKIHAKVDAKTHAKIPLQIIGNSLINPSKIK